MAPIVLQVSIDIFLLTFFLSFFFFYWHFHFLAMLVRNGSLCDAGTRTSRGSPRWWRRPLNSPSVAVLRVRIYLLYGTTKIITLSIYKRMQSFELVNYLIYSLGDTKKNIMILVGPCYKSVLHIVIESFQNVVDVVSLALGRQSSVPLMLLEDLRLLRRSSRLRGEFCVQCGR